MAFWDGLYKEFGDSGLFNQTQEQKEKIDGVLFDIWMRGCLERAPLKSAAVVLLSMVIRFLFSIVMIPHAIAKFLPSIVFSAIFSGLAYLTWSSMNIAFFVLMASFMFLERVAFMNFLRNFIYDVADIFSLGMLTKRKVKVLQNCGPMKRFKEDEFLNHLFISRPLPSGEFCREADEFQSVVKSLKDDWQSLNELIEGYWACGRSRKGYWPQKSLSLRKT